ncbi:nuclear transport factor 2 family protein [Sphingomonas sp.]|jgi:steroid delta-isomerase|uniref:YybH family protein n=1 Tax=Sphingomonas sp. TaxID=28214 RepID=UPI002DE5165E|nr:nuclear transport factor 2 family protein [Sphingomonas sp.]
MTEAQGALTREDMLRHASEWIDAWNRRDLDAVLAGYSKHASFRSPVAALVTGSPLVEGRAALEGYWRAGLSRLQSLRFDLLQAICDPDGQTMVVHYLASLDGPPKRACEIFRFEAGVKIYGEALYGDDVAGALRRD